jgi:hypothetical protein
VGPLVGALSDERMGIFCICCWSLPAQSFLDPSPLVLKTIYYCLKFETSLRRLLRIAGSCWRYSTPPSHNVLYSLPQHWRILSLCSFRTDHTENSVCCWTCLLSYCSAADSIETSYVIATSVAWCQPSVKGRLPIVIATRWVGICDINRTSWCAIQAFTELLPSNAPIQSATLPLRAFPQASVAQQFLHRANTPQYCKILLLLVCSIVFLLYQEYLLLFLLSS